MIDSLLSTPTTRLLEQTLDFTEQRHNLLLEDIANVSTPGFVQKDVSTADFQKSLRDAIDRQQTNFNVPFDPQSNDSVEFIPGSSVVQIKPQEAVNSVAFHDRGVRSMEYLMGAMADNAEAHNTVSALLKTRYDWINKAINMKP